MAVKKPDMEAPVAVDMEEKVEYTAPILLQSDEQPDVVVGVNGELIRIKRGVPVRIKRKFLEALQNAADQRMAAFQYQSKAQQQARQAFTNL